MQGSPSSTVDHRSMTVIQVPSSSVSTTSADVMVDESTSAEASTSAVAFSRQLPAVAMDDSDEQRASHPVLSFPSASVPILAQTLSTTPRQSEINTPPTSSMADRPSCSGVVTERANLAIAHFKTLAIKAERFIYSSFPSEFYISDAKMAVIVDHSELPFLVLKPQTQKVYGHILYIVHIHKKDDIKRVFTWFTRGLSTGGQKVTLKYVIPTVEPTHFFPIMCKAVDLFYRGGDLSAIANRIRTWTNDSGKDFQFLA